MAYFLQSVIPADWSFRLAIVELLLWVGVVSMVFLGRHEDTAKIKDLQAELAAKDAEIQSLRAARDTPAKPPETHASGPVRSA